MAAAGWLRTSVYFPSCSASPALCLKVPFLSPSSVLWKLWLAPFLGGGISSRNSSLGCLVFDTCICIIEKQLGAGMDITVYCVIKKWSQGPSQCCDNTGFSKKIFNCSLPCRAGGLCQVGPPSYWAETRNANMVAILPTSKKELHLLSSMYQTPHGLPKLS